jgi:hypothetical protein
MQLFRRQPGNCGVFVKGNGTGLDCADKRLEGNSEGRIAVHICWKAFSYPHPNAQFFNQFTSKAFLRSFTTIDFASGELPLEWQTHAGASLCGKNETVTFDNGAGNMKVFHQGVLNRVQANNKNGPRLVGSERLSPSYAILDRLENQHTCLIAVL